MYRVEPNRLVVKRGGVVVVGGEGVEKGRKQIAFNGIRGGGAQETAAAVTVQSLS